MNWLARLLGFDCLNCEGWGLIRVHSGWLYSAWECPDCGGTGKTTKEEGK